MTGNSPHQRIKTLQAQLDMLRDRTRRLSEATLGIHESLDYESVLQVVIDNARELTGAHFGGIAVLDEADTRRRLVTSGLTPQQQHQIVSETPAGSEYLQHVIGLSEPLRVQDLAAYFGSLGLPEFSHPLEINSHLAAPIRAREEAVGAIFLSKGPPDPEFDDEDAATLAMFASQAALVIANARQYRKEQRARADLETLIDTSPVGVAVFDARTGVPVRFNREFRRLGAAVSKSAKPVRNLLEQVTVRRADGRVTSLADNPLRHSMAAGETVRAEKIILSGPEGGSISVLANATPIRSANGDVESFVVTLQDVTPLEELERLRADLLGLVSAELREPLVTIKGSAVTLLESLHTLDPAETRQLLRILTTQADRMRDLIGELVDVAGIETGTLPVTVEPTGVDRLIDDAAEALTNASSYKQVIVDVAAGLPLVTADRRRIVYVIDTLVSTASRLSTGPEPLRLNARLSGDHMELMELSVIDPSCGPPTETLARLLDRIPQATKTAPGDDPDSGARGLGSQLGLAVCMGIVEAHGGRLWAETDRDSSKTRYAFTLPLAKPTAHSAARRRQSPAQDPTAHIAVIEDDPLTQRYIGDTLTAAGYRVTIATEIDQALPDAAPDPFDLVLASLEVTRRGGAEPAAALRPHLDGPVIVVAEYGQHDAIAHAVNTGAADYLIKPFSPTELTARVAAVLQRRAGPHHEHEQFALGRLTIDYRARTVALAGNPVPLSRTEFQLLRELAHDAGRVLSHDELIHRVWSSTSPRDPGILRSAIKRLRRKLGDSASKPKYIVTAPRMGYRIGDPTE